MINVDRLAELLATTINCKICPLRDKCHQYYWIDCEGILTEWLEGEDDE